MWFEIMITSITTSKLAIDGSGDHSNDSDHLNEFDDGKDDIKSISLANVSSLLWMLGLSDYQAVHIISAVAISLGHELSRLVVSRSSIRRARIKHRTKTATTIKAHFQV